MSSVTFTQKQIDHIEKYIKDGVESIMDYLNDTDEDGISPDNCRKFILKTLSCKGFEISKRAKHLVDDTDDESESETPTKAKKGKKVKKEKKFKVSFPTGHKLFIFGMKIDDLFEGSLKIVKNSDEMAEYGQDKSKGDIHKTSMKKANSNWSELENQGSWKELAESIKKEWLSLTADGEIDEEEKFSFEKFSKSKQEEFSGNMKELMNV